MGSPINGITSITYDKDSWNLISNNAFIMEGVDGIGSFPYSWPQIATSGNYTISGSTIDGIDSLLINDSSVSDQYESWVVETSAGSDTYNMSTDWSLSNFTQSSNVVETFTLTYTATTTSTTTSTTSTTTQNLPLVSLEMTLSQIHSTKTAQELSDNLSLYKSQIKGILDLNIESQSTYYKNHTGRELFRKLYNFGLSHLIPTTYDAGFRPDDNSLGS
jgi:hypothetical protein